jgi:hypothetical protein
MTKTHECNIAPCEHVVFSKKFNLTRHISTVHGNKQICSICETPISRLDNQHYKTNTHLNKARLQALNIEFEKANKTIASLENVAKKMKEDVDSKMVRDFYSKMRNGRYFIVAMKADGNCLFNAISFLLFGTQNYHEQLRYFANRLHELQRDVRSSLQHFDHNAYPLGVWGNSHHKNLLNELFRAPILTFTDYNFNKECDDFVSELETVNKVTTPLIIHLHKGHYNVIVKEGQGPYYKKNEIKQRGNYPLPTNEVRCIEINSLYLDVENFICNEVEIVCCALKKDEKIVITID